RRSDPLAPEPVPGRRAISSRGIPRWSHERGTFSRPSPVSPRDGQPDREPSRTAENARRVGCALARRPRRAIRAGRDPAPPVAGVDSPIGLPGVPDMRPLAILLLLATLAPRARADVPPVRAVRTDRPMVVDGVLDEEVWKNDQAVTAFTQRDPDQGVPPRQRTEVRLAFDDDALYVGARMYDTAPDSVIARLARRDNDSHSDVFAVMLDPFHDKRTGYYFIVSAAGTLMDGVLLNDGWDDGSWDGVRQARAHRDTQGWTCEMRIPFSQLRFRAGDQIDRKSVV